MTIETGCNTGSCGICEVSLLQTSLSLHVHRLANVLNLAGKLPHGRLPPMVSVWSCRLKSGSLVLDTVVQRGPQRWCGHALQQSRLATAG